MEDRNPNHGLIYIHPVTLTNFWKGVKRILKNSKTMQNREKNTIYDIDKCK